MDGKQLTLTWHVDDVKASHVKKKVIDDFIKWIKKMCEDVTPVKPSRGKRHDYLAMTLDFMKKGCVRIDMTDHVKNMIKDFKFVNEL